MDRDHEAKAFGGGPGVRLRKGSAGLALTMPCYRVLSTLMGKRPGKVQREIADLIEAEPDGAWSYEELARLIYGQDDRPVLFGSRLRARKVAVGRVLSTMQLPGTWVVVQAVFFHDRRFWLYDPCRLESWREILRLRKGGLATPRFGSRAGYITAGGWNPCGAETPKRGLAKRRQGACNNCVLGGAVCNHAEGWIVGGAGVRLRKPSAGQAP